MKNVPCSEKKTYLSVLTLVLNRIKLAKQVTRQIKNWSLFALF